jgi:hypothetical protein
MPDIQINIWYGDNKWVGEVVELRDTGSTVVFQFEDESWDFVMFKVSEYMLRQTRFSK